MTHEEMEKEDRRVRAGLKAPFPEHVLRWKPQSISGNRALAVAYLDARIVQDRLDIVVGLTNWRDDYEILEDGAVLCRLSVRICGEWITKADVGGESDQDDPGDRAKSAFSDALKRAAVKFGVGRYIYRLPLTWVDYDPAKKVLKIPSLPEWAKPAVEPAEKPAAGAAAKPSATKPATKPAVPTTGAELQDWLLRVEHRLEDLELLDSKTELSEFLGAAAQKKGLQGSSLGWSAEAVAWAHNTVLEFHRLKAAKKVQEAAEAEGGDDDGDVPN